MAGQYEDDMKRGNFEISGELLTALLGLPDDFKISGVEYKPGVNTVVIYGYSDSFADTLECAMSFIYPPSPRKPGGE